jgi:hypothetical protein
VTSRSVDWLVDPYSKMRSLTTAISEYLSLLLRSTVATRATSVWRDVGREALCTDAEVRKGRHAPIAVSRTAGRNRTFRTTELYVATSREAEQYASPFSSHQLVDSWLTVPNVESGRAFRWMLCLWGMALPKPSPMCRWWSVASTGRACRWPVSPQDARRDITPVPVGPSTDAIARKARHYERFSDPVLWRGVMCENTSGKPRVSGAQGAREPPISSGHDLSETAGEPLSKRSSVLHLTQRPRGKGEFAGVDGGFKSDGVPLRNLRCLNPVRCSG